ncbi:MAG: hypothetical protein ACXVEF_20880 [Polyangiales bacterium]
MTIDPALIRQKIATAKLELGTAEEALDQAIKDLEARGRAEKEIIGLQLEAAFNRLRSARATLAELEDALSDA